MKERICAIVLAAGEGRRMGGDKALLELGGKLAVELVSWKWRRTLFSLSRIVSKPKLSPFTQSNPTHRLPSTITSSR